MDRGPAGGVRGGRAGGRRAVWGQLGRLGLAAGLWLAAAGRAAAEAEWCDDGSPPPNDFRAPPPGTGSATSAPAWLRRTDTGGPLLATSAASSRVDVGQVGQRSGGGATGMSTVGDARSGAAARR